MGARAIQTVTLWLGANPSVVNARKCKSVLVENTFRGGRVAGIKCHNAECDYKEAASPKVKDTEEVAGRELAAV